MNEKVQAVAPSWSLRRHWLFAVVSVAAVGAAAAQTYTLIDLGTLGGLPSVAKGINNSNEVVGSSNSRPFLWSNGVMSDLGSLGPYGFANGINDEGQIVGASSTPNPQSPGCEKGGGFCLYLIDEATLWSAGSTTGLGTLSGPNSYANGINDSGQVVGIAGVPDPNGYRPYEHAFLYSAGVMTDLNAQGGGGPRRMQRVRD